jgi:hypothetical protein
MSNASGPFLNLKEQRSRKRCPYKQILAQDLWPSIKLQGIRLPIRLHGIKLQGIKLLNIKPYGIKSQAIMPHSSRLLSISNFTRDLFLPIKIANPSTSKSRRRWLMINTAMSYLFGSRT